MDVNKIYYKNLKNMKIFKGKETVKNNLNNNLNNNFSFRNTSKLLMLAALLVVFLACVSSVTGAEIGNDANTGKNIQDLINNPNDGNEIILDSGDYINNIKNLNITRSVTIKGNGQVNIIGSSSDTLFNISARNVIISNLNISGYKTAVFSSNGSLSIKGCNISTTGISIDLKGSELTDISIENNNIISSVSTYLNGIVTVGAVKNSTVSISIKGNNITSTGSGSYTVGLYFNVASCHNTLTFKNNKISAKDYTGVHISGDNSNNTITFINNDITFKGIGSSSTERGIFISMGSGNNTITFSGNNISSTSAAAVYLGGNSAPSNTITFTKNKITLIAPSMTRTAVYLISSTGGGTNTITFKDNFISAASRMAVNFDIDNKTNIITFINNEIIQKENSAESYGLYIHASRSNNTMTIIDNNITGLWRTLALNIDGSNNTISVRKNNIKATVWTGFVLNLAGSENNILSIVENNITGNEYALYIFSQNNYITELSGISILNNNLNADNGLAINVLKSVLKNINITGNTIIAKDIGIKFMDQFKYFDSTVAITVNYNRILANIGLNFTDVNDAGSSFDYNWWGVNDIDEKILGFETKNHYILYFANLTDLSNVHVGDKVTFALLVVNTTLTSEGVENLPYFVINGTFNGIEFEVNLDELFIYEFTVLEEGPQYLEATLDYQDEDISFEGFKVEEIEIPSAGSNDTEDEIDSNIPDTDDESYENIIIDSQTKKGKDKNTNKSNGEDTDDEIDNSSEVLTSYAGMKSTGVPIAILLILAIFSLVSYRKKH